MFKNIEKLDGGKISEDNSLIVYYLVRKDLNMSIGKIAGQCSHATQYLMINYYTKAYFYKSYNSKSYNSKSDDIFVNRMSLWKNTKTHTKIILGCSDKDWYKLKEEYDFIYVIDAGKTELEPGTETVGILYPMLREERNKLLKKQQLLK